jgi:hypothetical protein
MDKSKYCTYWDKSKYIKLRSKNKVAYLFSNNIFNVDIVEEVENERLQIFFVFKKTDEVEKCLQEFRDNNWLTSYLKSFKNVNFEIAKYKSENI